MGNYLIELWSKLTCLWTLVSLFNPCFIPNLSVAIKVSEIEYYLMKLGISSQDLQYLIQTKTRFDEQYEPTGKANPKLGMKLV
jgi:hypothetical protein